MPDAIWPDAGELSAHARTPLYQQLEDLIRSRIADGRLGPGDMLPPELDLAERFGVSRTTIRQALGALVQEGMLSRTAGRGTFVERSRPQGLHAVALVCPFTQWYMGDLIDGLERVLKSAGYELIVRNSQHSAEAEVCELEQLQSLDVAGVVLWPESTSFAGTPPAIVRTMLNDHRPLVVLDQPVEFAPAVCTDHFGGGYLVGEHLIRRGYRRIGFVTVSHELRPSERARWEGLREVLHNQAHDAICFAHVGDNEGILRDWVLDHHLDALFAVNDLTALGAISQLARGDIAIPGQLAVVGYDDIGPAATANPPLTTVKQDFRALGSSAGRLILERIRTPHDPIRSIVLPVRLMVRASCGTPVGLNWAFEAGPGAAPVAPT